MQNLQSYQKIHARMNERVSIHRELGQGNIIGVHGGRHLYHGRTFSSPKEKAQYLQSATHARMAKSGAGERKTGPVGAVAPGSGSPGEGPRALTGRYDLPPQDCTIHGIVTIGDSSIAIAASGQVTVGSGSCRCMTTKFMQAAAYRASDSDATNLIEDCSPCPVLLTNSRSGVYPNKLDTATGAAFTFTDIDQAPLNCANWHSFSSITGCQLTLDWLNIIDDGAIHVLMKMYVICEGGCCDF